jgi:glycosyltransferase involved in cell wall biosynthesis
MRICAVTSFPPTVAGVADYGAFLVEELARDGRVEHVTVLADRVKGAPEREVAQRVEILRVWERDRANIGLTLDRAIARTDADVVWFNLGLTMFGTSPAAVTAMVAPLAARLRGRRTVVTLHELPQVADLATLGIGRVRGRLVSEVVLRVLLRADAVVVTLDRYREHLARGMGARNVTHVAHHVSAPPEHAEEPHDETILVFGTFGPHKDPGQVARAVATLRVSRPGLRLVVAGADNPRYPGFMDHCRAAHDLGDSWRGYVPRAELPALFAGATVVVVPAHASTGSSGVIHRAVAHGRAVLVSDLPDFRALAREEDLALEWYRPGDAASLSDALGGLLSDPSRREALVRHNRTSVARSSPRRIVDAYLATFGRREPVPSVVAEGHAPARLAVESVTEA